MAHTILNNPYSQYAMELFWVPYSMDHTVHFSSDYDFEANNLKVHVMEATDLPPMDLNGTSDPYVKVYLMPGTIFLYI